MAKPNNNVTASVTFNGAQWSVYGKKRSKDQLMLTTNDRVAAAKKVVTITYHNSKGGISYDNALKQVDDARNHFRPRPKNHYQQEMRA